MAITRAKEKNFVIFQINAYITAYRADKVLARQAFLSLLINGVIESNDKNEKSEIEENVEIEGFSDDSSF